MVQHNATDTREPIYLTIAETCELMRASRWTIGRRIKDGDLTAVKNGPRVLISRASIDCYIERQTVPAGTGR
jgi:excisionase family DNA binding protein